MPSLDWIQAERFKLIELIVFWERRLTTGHLTAYFGIQRQLASRVIAQYLNFNPNSLIHDTKLKGYRPTESFMPKVTQGVLDEYLTLLTKQQQCSAFIHSVSFDSLWDSHSVALTNNPPLRSISPEFLKPILNAIQHNLRIETLYVSMSNPSGDERIICPHALVFNGVRWHVRAYCEKNKDFRDFVLSRFRTKPDCDYGQALKLRDDDINWNLMLSVNLAPNPALTLKQQEIVKYDYAINKGSLTIKVRAALIKYWLDFMQVSLITDATRPEANPLVVSNLDAIKEYIY